MAARSFPFRTRDGRAALVRVARARDARAAVAIQREAAAERPRAIISSELDVWSQRVWRRNRLAWTADGVTLVGEIEGRVVGVLGCRRDRTPRLQHTAEFGITVARDARGQGVGRALLKALETWASEHGVDRMTLGVFPWNERAVRLYRSMGYEEEGTFRRAVRFPEGDADLLRMAKDVGPGRRPGATITAVETPREGG